MTGCHSAIDCTAKGRSGNRRRPSATARERVERTHDYRTDDERVRPGQAVREKSRQFPAERLPFHRERAVGRGRREFGEVNDRSRRVNG